jgi:hypothetical protein
MNKFLQATLAATAIVATAPAAQAAIAVTNTVAAPTTVSAAVNPMLTSISFDDNMVTGDATTRNFAELLSFTLTEASTVIFTLSTSFAPIDFTNVFVTNSGGGTVFTFGGTAGDPNPELLNGTTQLAAGTFTLNILGRNTDGPGTLGGTVTAGAVPEPATWAMFLMGFGAVGYSMRSRKVGYKAVQAV